MLPIRVRMNPWIAALLLLVWPAADVTASTISVCQDPCNSFATAPAGVLFACPQGDGDALAANGLTITVTLLDDFMQPCIGIPASDMWLVGCDDNILLALCGGSTAISPSGPTDANGVTTFTGDLAAGGCDLSGIRVVVQGWVIGAGLCADPCVPIKVKSADLNANLVVNLVDFATFGAGYASPPQPYNECIDFVAPFGTVSLSDFAKYGTHSNHAC